MSRELDRRNFSINRVTPARKRELDSLALEVSNRLAGAHRVRIEEFNATTGNPSVVVSESAPVEKGNYLQRALDHMRNISQALGLKATQPVEFMADPNVQETSSGAVVVHLQQHYKGIPIFQAAEAVHFAPDGALKETMGSSITVDKEAPFSPKLSVEQAVLKAAQHVAVPHADEQGATDQFGQPLTLASVDLSGFMPKVIAVFTNKAEQPAVLEAGPFGDEIKARLVWFPLDDALRLSWEVIMTMPDEAGQYRTLVDAESGEILYCRQLMQFVTARGHVYRVDGRDSRELTDFPQPLEDYGLSEPTTPLPDGFPDRWVAEDSTLGNCVRAHLGSDGPVLRGSIQDGLLTFDPADPTGDDQKVLNIFYYNCFMHDYFYQLGFRETEGNFQRDNFGRGGRPADPVDARAHPGTVRGTANMATPIDGRSPIMNMGLVSRTDRHTAFDSSVVFHEFTHGVTNRLVGGPLNDEALEAPQSRGMGEGWSDYIPCTINNTTVIGDWVVGEPGGIRAFPYTSQFPDHFGLLGTGRYTEEHNIGEIWCATLIEMNRNIGARLGVQLVVDALKLTPANPGFLDARDAILRALDDKQAAGQLSTSEYAQAQGGIWRAFAKLGMGYQARSNGASLSGIVASFEIPLVTGQPETGPSVHVEATPSLLIPDNNPTGVSSTLVIAQAGTLQGIKVSIDITHSYIGDLRVEVMAPSGPQAILHNRAGGSQDNLVTTYDSVSTSSLARLIGQPIQGRWVLRVADLAGRDVGRLNRWSLELSYGNE